MPTTGTRVSQDRAKAGNDLVGNDKITNIYNSGKPRSVVDDLIEKLQGEIDGCSHAKSTIESLARFQKQRTHDSIVGLEAKLCKANRECEVLDALEQKELFAKLLETWSLYASAQEIFAFLLAKAEYEFKFFILPQVGTLNEIEINQLVHDKVVEPTTNLCGGSMFTIDHSVAMGMVYWLAEQCYIRWHK